MLTITVELLTGRYTATRFNDRSAAEWPPHPARLFSAMVAVWAEDALGDNAATALDWLAAAGAPEIFASEATVRTVPNVYVPGLAQPLMEWERVESALVDVERAKEALAAAETENDPRALKAARRAVEKALEQLEKVRKQEIIEGRPRDNAAQVLELLPSRRDKQPRMFPSVTPVIPVVSFVWNADPPAPSKRELANVLARVHRLGHSSSLVACRIDDAPPVTDDDARVHWMPDAAGNEMIRVPEKGQRERLVAAFQEHQGFLPRTLPFKDQRYRRRDGRITATFPESVFGTDWLVFREVPVNNRRLGLRLTMAPDIARALRNSFMSYADHPPPPVLTGHRPTGEPLTYPHAAFLSLADLGSRWASGSVLGAAIVLPRDIAYEDRLAILRAIGRWERDSAGALPLKLGRAGVLWLERVKETDPRITLQPHTWSHAAAHWATVTPVALDANPGDLTSPDAEVAERAADNARRTIAKACTHIGLPEPRAIEIHRRSIFDACPPARAFMPFPKKEGAVRRVCVHAEIIFDQQVRGPILLGAGRYQGLGLLRPVPGT